MNAIEYLEQMTKFAKEFRKDANGSIDRNSHMHSANGSKEHRADDQNQTTLA
jgi:hypothetical protein